MVCRLLILITLFFCIFLPGTPVDAKLFNTRDRASNSESENTEQGGYGLGKEKGEREKPSTQGDLGERIDQDIKNTGMGVLTYVKGVGKACVEDWATQNCMKNLSILNRDTASFYAQNLNDSGRKDADAKMEELKQHCAASTAALKVDVPAYAMRSAMTECVNTISDIVDATKVKPNVNMYQLMVGSILCLQKDAQCKFIENQLKAAQ